jgi:hypothetical protein
LLITENEFVDAGMMRGTRAKKVGIKMGSREKAGSLHHPTAARALAYQKSQMAASSRYRFFIQSAFFLRFPFRATAPFDSCYYIRRMIFTTAIRRSATNILRALKESHNVTRLMAVHLRLELDSHILDPRAALISPRAVQRFFEDQLIPIAKAASIQGIYISSGKLKQEYAEVLRRVPFAVFTKDQFRKQITVTADNAITTSHTAAAMDTLILAHSSIAVTFQGSTLTMGVASRRCPSPGKKGRASYSQFFPGNRTVVRPQAAGADPTPVVQGPMPKGYSGESGLDPSFFVYTLLGGGAGGQTLTPPAGAAAVNGTTRSPDAVRFSRLHYLSCDRPIGSQCFFEGLSAEDEQKALRGIVPAGGDALDLPEP